MELTGIGKMLLEVQEYSQINKILVTNLLVEVTFQVSLILDLIFHITIIELMMVVISILHLHGKQVVIHL